MGRSGSGSGRTAKIKKIESLVNHFTIMEHKFLTIEKQSSEKEYDEEIFDLADKELTKEFREAEVKDRVKILMERMIDCASLFLDPNKRPSIETKLFERFGMRPMKIDLLQMEDNKEITVEAYRSALLGGKERSGCSESIGLIYGPTRIFFLPPNEMIKTELDDQDIICTARLSSCSVLMERDGNKITIVHITTPQEVPEAGKKIIKEASAKASQQVVLITPEFSPIRGDKKSAMAAKEFNGWRTILLESLRRYAEVNQVEFKDGDYPYISADAERDRRVSETLVMAGKDFCFTVGYSWETDDRGKTSFVFYPETVHFV